MAASRAYDLNSILLILDRCHTSLSLVATKNYLPNYMKLQIVNTILQLKASIYTYSYQLLAPVSI